MVFFVVVVVSVIVVVVAIVTGTAFATQVTGGVTCPLRHSILISPAGLSSGFAK